MLAGGRPNGEQYKRSRPHRLLTSPNPLPLVSAPYCMRVYGSCVSLNTIEAANGWTLRKLGGHHRRTAKHEYVKHGGL